MFLTHALSREHKLSHRAPTSVQPLFPTEIHFPLWIGRKPLEPIATLHSLTTSQWSSPAVPVVVAVQENQFGPLRPIHGFLQHLLPPRASRRPSLPGHCQADPPPARLG